MTLGFRAEDATIVAADGQVAAPVYSIELLGEASMISYRIGDALVSIKAPKEYRAEIDDVAYAAVPAAICHLFDKASGKLALGGQHPAKVARNADAGRRGKAGNRKRLMIQHLKRGKPDADRAGDDSKVRETVEVILKDIESR